tara:strand:- start:39840 stop:40070 length:231 start_codon:yes stop_codon:yes gene_type:complete
MELFNKVASIQAKSKRAVSTFQKVASDLASANAEIEKADAVRVAKMEVLSQERADLDTVFAQNEKIINKLNEFLGI